MTGIDTILDPLRFASPLNEHAFKLLFMDDGAEPRLMSLINSVLNLTGKNKIIELTAQGYRIRNHKV